ncbi:MAG: hypothetical protein V4550_02675 [Gemmatimonadota bacterium]
MTDYDRTDIPTGYDRARDHGPEVLDLWMRTIAAHVEGRSITRILDLGCGTGRGGEALCCLRGTATRYRTDRRVCLLCCAGTLNAD